MAFTDLIRAEAQTQSVLHGCEKSLTTLLVFISYYGCYFSPILGCPPWPPCVQSQSLLSSV
eukprot:1755102-Amphidinium_carterae.1